MKGHDEKDLLDSSRKQKNGLTCGVFGALGDVTLPCQDAKNCAIEVNASAAVSPPAFFVCVSVTCLVVV